MSKIRPVDKPKSAPAWYERTGFSVAYYCPYCAMLNRQPSTDFDDDELWGTGSITTFCDECGYEVILDDIDRQVQ